MECTDNGLKEPKPDDCLEDGRSPSSSESLSGRTTGENENVDWMTTSDDGEDDEHNNAGLDRQVTPGIDASASLDDDMRNSLHTMASRLCSTCREFPHGDIVAGTYRLYHPSVYSLRQSVEGGCPLCRQLEECWDRTDTESDFLKSEKENLSIKCSMSNGTLARSRYPVLFFDFHLFHVRMTSEKGVPLMDTPCRLAGLARPGPEFLDPELESTTSKSATSIELARSWLRQCSTHVSCQSHKVNKKHLPTRLVQVCKSDDSPSGVAAKLCETSGLSAAETPYVTLSHCWGETPQFTLRRHNLEALRREIPVRKLSKLFQDALYMADQVGINYIWIDCLCIMQDSIEDWEKEATAMGDVYRYAECNLAATGYEDGSLGLFGKRKALPLTNPPMRVDCVLTPPQGREHTERYTGLYVPVDERDFDEKITRGHLSSRGWVAQERALSSAVLHFTPEQLWWECTYCVANEAYPDTDAEVIDTHFSPYRSMRYLRPESTRESIYKAWRDFVGFYAGTQLTVPTDRFPAVVGIARLVGANLDDNFVAGFWEGDLVRSLAWCPVEGTRRIPSAPLAPSWSWASLEAPNGCGEAKPLEGIRTRVLSDIPGFRSDLDFGSIWKSGVRGLAVRGPLRTIPVGFQENAELVEVHVMGKDVRDLSFYSSSGITVPSDQLWRWEAPTHMLPLVEGPPRRDGGSWICCLLLGRVPESDDPDTFRRLGFVEFRFTSQGVSEGLGLLLEENGKFRPSMLFAESGLQDLIMI